MAYSGTFPMNDRDPPNRNNALTQDLKRSLLDHRARTRSSEHRPRIRRQWGGRLFTLGGFLMLGCGIVFGAWARYSQQQQVMATAEQSRDFVPSLQVAKVEPTPDTTSVFLPGTTAAFAAADIYARATGYIAKRNVDIGDHVKAGELLAQLAVPELDDQISQNEATLNQLKSALVQAEASLKLAQVTWSRDEPLVNKGWVTEQQGTIDVQTVKGREPQLPLGNTMSRPKRSCSSSFVITGITPRWSRRLTASSPSATSMSAVWCRGMPPAAPSCSRSCRRTRSASRFTCRRTRLSA